MDRTQCGAGVTAADEARAPIERVQAAIDKLTTERDVAARGPWVTNVADTWWLEGVNHRVVRGTPQEEVAFTYGPEADLIVTLHRTIDAQLGVLRLAIEYGPLTEGQGPRFWRAAIVLADTILAPKGEQ